MAAQTLDHFVPGISTQDTKKRIEVGEELVAYLQNEDSSLYCEEMDKLVDGVAGWISSSNYKVSLQSQEALSHLIGRMAGHFKPHVTTVLPAVVDRLGDSKDLVRESAKDLLLKLMSPASSPQFVVDRLSIAFTHKLWKVKEETLICLQRAINEFGAKSLGLSKVVPLIIKLLDDQSIPVRDQTVNTLVEIYRHVGEKVRSDLTKKEINPSKLNLIFAKMDDVRNSGKMLATENNQFDDETDQSMKPAKQRSSSSSRTSAAVNLKTSKSSSMAAGASSGAMDEDTFIKSFEDVPRIYISSSKDVADRISRIRDVLSDPNNDWEKRNDCLKELRSLFVGGAVGFPDFQQNLRTLEACVRLCIQDLRSQVVREACITIAYMSQLLCRDFDHFAEAILSALIALIPNTAKIMATSGTIALRFIVQYTHVARLIPLVTCNLTSKNNIIRRQCCELVDLMLRTWPSNVLERQAAVLQDAIKRGLADADTEARVHSRKAYWGFEENFKQQAFALFNALDPTQQKLLQGVSSSSSSTNSLNNPIAGTKTTSAASAKEKARNRSASNDRAASSGYGRSHTTSTSTLPLRSTQASAKASRIPKTGGSQTENEDDDENIVRSNSTANLASTVGASRVNSNYNSLRSSQSTTDLSSPPKTNVLRRNASMRVHPSGSPLSNASRQKKTLGGNSANQMMATGPERTRSHSKSGMSQSQPGSRSVSPSSRLSYLTHVHPDVTSTGGGGASRVWTSSLAHSQSSSRDGSPNRTSHGRDKKSFGAGRVAMRKDQKSGEQRILRPDDIESVVADALLNRSTRKRVENGESEDAASETSSVCSEGSYRSYGNTSEDMSEIIAGLSSGSWSDRRDGLVSLQNLLQANRLLNRAELKKVCDIFTRMFHDPHGKVFSAFLETLIDFVNVHKSYLHDWLYICLPRLINKMGADLLGSIQAKIQKTLDIIKISFECEHQFNILTKFVVDQTQTPNLKVKVALLNYLHGLALLMIPDEFTNTSDTRLAVSRVITWTTEPKSVEVRKAAQAVLVALCNLNSTEFSLMLRVLPKTFQEGATRILQGHLQAAGSDMEPLSPRNVTSPPAGATSRYRNTPNRSDLQGMDTENVNPEDLYNSIRKTSAEIQNLSRFDGPYGAEKDNGFGSIPDPRKLYNPNNYQDERNNGMCRSNMSDAVYDVENDIFSEEFPLDHIELIDDIIIELSNTQDRCEERRNAMLNLIRITREDDEDIWTEHFKTILLLLLETLADKDDNLRTLSLRVLREIIRRQPTRFKDYAELTILKILEAQKNETKEVVRIAEECATALAKAVPPEQCIAILNPFTESPEYPTNLAAIKMQIKVVEVVSDKDLMLKLLPQLIPGLLKGYDNSESRVRKASVFCLVAVYLVVGDDLRPFLKELSGSKMKLLNLYIKRGLAQKGEDSSDATSKTSSPISIGDLI